MLEVRVALQFMRLWKYTMALGSPIYMYIPGVSDELVHIKVRGSNSVWLKALFHISQRSVQFFILLMKIFLSLPCNAQFPDHFANKLWDRTPFLWDVTGFWRSWWWHIVSILISISQSFSPAPNTDISPKTKKMKCFWTVAEFNRVIL